MQTSHEPIGSRPTSKSQPAFGPGRSIADRYDVEAQEPPRPYGEHYRVKDRTDGRQLSLVLLWPELTSDARSVAELEQKIVAVRGLVHKNLAQPSLMATVDVAGVRRHYVVFEYVDGTSVRLMIEQRRASAKAIAPKTVYNVAAHLCNALAFAHTVSPHGCVGSDAVRINGAGRVKLLDFGFAPLTARLGLLVGKDLAPDANGGSSVAGDVWSVGSVVYQLLSGEPPSAPYVPIAAKAGVPAAVDIALARALSPTAKSRFADVAQLKETLASAFASAEGSSSTPVTEDSQVVPGGAVGIPTAPAKAALAPAPPPVKAAPTAPPVTKAPSSPPIETARPKSSGPAPRALDQPPMIDENEERFMVHKDKMDFGPMSLREMISQIETGKIRGDHLMTDTHTDQRTRVRDHANLRALVTDAEAKLAEAEREQGEQIERKRQSRRITGLLGILVGVIALGAAGTVFYMSQLKPRIEKQVIEKDPEIKWDVSLKVDPAEKRKTTRKPRVGGKPGEFDEVTNLGDASQGGGDEVLDPGTVQRVMMSNYKVLVGCINEERGRNPTLRTVEMDFIVRGAGNVSAVKVNGSTSGALPECMYAKMQTVTFPKFNGSKTHASFSLNLK